MTLKYHVIRVDACWLWVSVKRYIKLVGYRGIEHVKLKMRGIFEKGGKLAAECDKRKGIAIKQDVKVSCFQWN